MATVPTRKYATCRRVCTTSGVLPLAGGDRTGRKDLTRKTQTGNGRSDPAMRSKTSHAAKSGVGEHTARESESAQRVRRGLPAATDGEARFEVPSCRLAGGHGRRGTLRCTELPACRRPRAAGHRPKPREHPNCARGPSVRRRHRRRHGQPGQRERRQDFGPGNRTEVQSRERGSGNRSDRFEAATLPGNWRWSHWHGAGQPVPDQKWASPAMPSGTTGDV
jgi:hypothetical protein